MSTFQFNKVTIFEALRTDDRKSGRDIFDDLENLKIFHPDILDVDFIELSKKSKFVAHIEKLTQEALLSGEYPIVQIDAHGNKEGIEFSPNEIILWDEMLALFIELNISMKGNLLVVMGTCFGASIIHRLSHTSRAPFWGVIAPFEETYYDNVYVGLTRFYTAVCNGKSTKEILSLLRTNDSNSDLQLFTAELLFVKAHQIAYQELKNKESMGSRARKWRDELKNQGIKFVKPARELKLMLLNNSKEEFAKNLSYFMLVDMFPENVNKISKEHNPWDPLTRP